MAGRVTKAARIEAAMIHPSNSVVASAARYDGKAPRIFQPTEQWQRDAYRHYGICGEARYAANYHGNSLSKAKLSIDPAATSPKAQAALAALFNGNEGQSDMLRAIGIHLTVGGECYLVGRNVAPTKENHLQKATDVWEVLSTLEVNVNGANWTIKSKERGENDIPLADDDVVIRIWRPHPEHRASADSPFRSLLPTLTSIEYLTRHIFAQCTSRLAGAGLLFVTDGIQFPPPKNDKGETVEFANAAEGLLLALAEGMMRPLEDPGAPEGLVPLVCTVPEELMKTGKITELLHFWTDLDAKALEMRDSDIKRFALGMDLPPEKLLGLSHSGGTGGGKSMGVNHWSGWQIDEETISLHTEPMLDLVVGAITVGYIRVLTSGDEKVVYDTTALRLRPDRSKESITLYGLGLVKATTVLRENGFDAVLDMMDDEERKVWLMVKVATGSATPEQVQSALRTLGVNLGTLVTPEAPTRETRPDPSTEDHPTRDLPVRPAANLLLAAAEPMVLMALQRAGNRLRSKGSNPPNVPAYAVHTVVAANGSSAYALDDAFPTAELCLEGIAPVTDVVPVLESYCRSLLAEQEPHTRARLAQWLTLAELMPA